MGSDAQGVTASIVLWSISVVIIIITPFVLLLIQFILEYTRKKKAIELGSEQKTTETLVFQDICYYIHQKKKQRKAILKNISGFVRPGEVCALMGQSGAGSVCALSKLKVHQLISEEQKNNTITYTLRECFKGWNFYVRGNIHQLARDVRLTLNARKVWYYASRRSFDSRFNS